jgi:hypothetical protein
MGYGREVTRQHQREEVRWLAKIVHDRSSTEHLSDTADEILEAVTVQIGMLGTVVALEYGASVDLWVPFENGVIGHGVQLTVVQPHDARQRAV